MTPDQGDASRSLTDKTRVRGHGVSSSELGDQIPGEMLTPSSRASRGGDSLAVRQQYKCPSLLGDELVPWLQAVKNITFQCLLEKSTAAPQQEEKQRKGKQLSPVEMHFQIQDGPSTLWGGGHAETRLEQPAVVVAREKSSASLLCTANVKASYIHWYRYQEGKGLQRLLHLAMFQSNVQWDSVLEADKVTAIETKDGYSCTLLVLKLEKSDEGMYYCAAWRAHSHSLCPGPPCKKVTDSGPFRPGTFHSVWVSGVVLGSALSNQTLAGTPSAGRALEAKEPLVLSVAQTQGAVQPGGTFLQIVRSKYF
ncbi:uncharacterized protein LOC119864147 isoform X1 [Canis lupus familiaris]|uniref:uncharacterized protein LOC119864147 isoform X1 n=1 Tax=Canis lupus familiaris TaxID=9615 RepID=UPI0018F39324|nr:uncharacterized protein LOC119864147 isoform X1 [Canis lupus familiaris]XP_038309869.1 uncharacterized protein LOC119864147 isoform X1 [Canis lupus familiaris]